MSHVCINTYIHIDAPIPARTSGWRRIPALNVQNNFLHLKDQRSWPQGTVPAASSCSVRTITATMALLLETGGAPIAPGADANGTTTGESCDGCCKRNPWQGEGRELNRSTSPSTSLPAGTVPGGALAARLETGRGSPCDRRGQGSPEPVPWQAGTRSGHGRQRARPAAGTLAPPPGSWPMEVPGAMPI